MTPQLVFVADTACSSRAIEYFGGLGWSHAASLVGPSTVIDARSDRVHYNGVVYKPGVQYRDAGYLWEQPKWVRVSFEKNTDKYQSWKDALVDQLGKPYDHIGILDFIDGSYKDRNWRDQSAWFCSELVTWALEQAGMCPRLPDPVYKITPGSALLLAVGLGAVVVASRG